MPLEKIGNSTNDGKLQKDGKKRRKKKIGKNNKLGTKSETDDLPNDKQGQMTNSSVNSKYGLGQAWATSDQRATCGPPNTLMQTGNFFKLS